MDSLAMTCQAMWELLRDRTDLTDEDIEEKLQEIDLRDGSADGKMTSTVGECPACHRTVNSRHDRCLYCGVEISKDHIFEG